MNTVAPFPKRRGTSIDALAIYQKHYLSIDPGVDTGWALWDIQNRLVACGLGYPPFEHALRVAIERPEIYPGNPVPPNDIVTLAFLAGRYAGAANPEGTADGVEVVTVLPKQWKGQLPKEVCAGRILGHLSTTELQVVREAEGRLPKGKRHNMIDAVGVGLFVFRGVKI